MAPTRTQTDRARAILERLKVAKASECDALYAAIKAARLTTRQRANLRGAVYRRQLLLRWLDAG